MDPANPVYDAGLFLAFFAGGDRAVCLVTSFAGESEKGKLSGVKGSRLISNLSDVAWRAFQSVNQRLPEGESIRPNWAPGPLLKSYERSAPPLGFPRETDSLCPTCVKEVRNVISGEVSLETLMNEHPVKSKRRSLKTTVRLSCGRTVRSMESLKM